MGLKNYAEHNTASVEKEASKGRAMTARTVTFGKNWVRLKPGFWAKIRGRCEYAVLDLLLDDGDFFLDRFFISSKIRVWYPAHSEYRHPDYPHCTVYFIQVKKEDEAKAIDAMNNMYDRAPLMEHSDEYVKSIRWLESLIISPDKPDV